MKKITNILYFSILFSLLCIFVGCSGNKKCYYDIKREIFINNQNDFYEIEVSIYTRPQEDTLDFTDTTKQNLSILKNRFIGQTYNKNIINVHRFIIKQNANSRYLDLKNWTKSLIRHNSAIKDKPIFWQTNCVYIISNKCNTQPSSYSMDAIVITDTSTNKVIGWECSCW